MLASPSPECLLSQEACGTLEPVGPATGSAVTDCSEGIRYTTWVSGDDLIGLNPFAAVFLARGDLLLVGLRLDGRLGAGARGG